MQRLRPQAGRLIALAAAALASTTVFAKAEWTIMYYWAGDNDLEEPMMEDIKELMKTGSSEDVELIVLFDRAEGYDRGSLGGIRNWTSTKWLRVENGRLEELEDWGERDTADPETLFEFMDRTAERFPANRYKLVMNDHGAAWQNAFYDEGGRRTSTMSTLEIQEALTQFRDKHQRLDILSFDACLMACVETSYAFRDLAEYIIASQEELPLFGYEYTNSMKDWIGNPRRSTEELATRFVRYTNEFYTKNGGDEAIEVGVDTTISLVRSSAMSELRSSIMAMARHFDEFGKSGEGLTKLKLIVGRVGRFGGDEPGSETGQVDLGQIATLLKQNPLNSDSVAIADAVLKNLDSTVIASLNGPVHGEATGLSVFWPRSNQYLTGSNRYSSAYFNKDDSAWSDFVTAFVRLLRRR